MKKTPIFPILATIAFYLFIILTALYDEGELPNPFDYARITDVEYKAILIDEPNSEAKILVTEQLTFDIHAASKSNLFWELWRDLCEDSVDGVKNKYKVKSVKEILSNGKEIVYEESPKLYWYDEDYTGENKRYGPRKWYHSPGPYNEDFDLYECVFFYVDGIYREKVVFELEYEMTNAALRYGDCSELYISLFSENSVNYLESFKGEILIPLKDMPQKGNYEAHTYGTTANSFKFKESTKKYPGYHTFYFNLDKDDLNFTPPYEYIEFSLVSFGDDKHKFTDNAPKNIYYNYPTLDEIREAQEEYDNMPIKAAKDKTIALVICISGSILLIIYTLTKDKSIRKKHNFYEPTDKPIFYRDIPSNLDPTFAAHLVFCKQKHNNESNVYSAIMLSLVRKGYIKLEKIDSSKGWYNSNVNIVVLYKPITKPIVNSIRSIRVVDENNDTSPVEFVDTLAFSDTKIVDEQVVLDSKVEEPAPVLPELEPLSLTEKYYFNLIVRHCREDGISMKKFQSSLSRDYANTDIFVSNMDNSVVNIGVSQGYFQKADYQQPKKNLKNQSTLFAIIGFILIIVVNLISYQTLLGFALGGHTILGITFILSSIYLRFLSKKYILLTQFGEDEYAKWRALYNFLNSETLMKERTLIELPLWEQYLVYATAFGISEKVISALKIRCPDFEQSPMLSNPYYRTKLFYSTSGRSFRTVTRNASYTARGGSYGSHHSGYGGGGRGGGGGGGGH